MTVLAGQSFLPVAPYGDVGSLQLWLPLGGPAAQPGFLTAKQLASLQATVLSSLPWVGTVLRNVPIRDASGELLPNWQPVAAYNCDIEFMGDDEESEVAGQVQAIGSYMVTLPWNAVIQAEDRIAINGVTYELRNRLTNWTDQCAVYVSAEEVRS